MGWKIKEREVNVAGHGDLFHYWYPLKSTTVL